MTGWLLSMLFEFLMGSMIVVVAGSAIGGLFAVFIFWLVGYV